MRDTFDSRRVSRCKRQTEFAIDCHRKAQAVLIVGVISDEIHASRRASERHRGMFARLVGNNEPMEAGEASPARRGLFAGAIAIAIVIVVGASSFIVWDRSFRRAGPSNPSFDCPQKIDAKHRVPFAAVGVHRVALIGDSIMVQASCALAESLADLGIETTRHAVSGSGLLNGIVDWNQETGRILQTEHPDVVVAIFVGNYLGPPALTEDGATIAPDTPAFFHAWQQHAIAISMQVRKAG